MPSANRTHIPDDREDELHPSAPLLSERLTAWARTRDVGERAAVAALIEEDTLLARDDIRRLLVVETDTSACCDWAPFEDRYRRALDLDDGEDAFLTYVIAIAFPRVVPLWRLEALDDRRLAVVLRALTGLAGSDAVAVGTRTGAGTC